MSKTLLLFTTSQFPILDQRLRAQSHRLSLSFVSSELLRSFRRAQHLASKCPTCMHFPSDFGASLPTNNFALVQSMSSLLGLVQLAWGLPKDSTRLYVASCALGTPADRAQNGPSWMIVDSNETPGGLASTDVTKEGFVCARYNQEMETLMENSSTMSEAMLFSPTTNTSMIASTRLYQRKMIGIRTKESHMSAAKAYGCHIHSRTTSPCYPRKIKSNASTA